MLARGRCDQGLRPIFKTSTNIHLFRSFQDAGFQYTNGNDGCSSRFHLDGPTYIVDEIELNNNACAMYESGLFVEACSLLNQAIQVLQRKNENRSGVLHTELSQENLTAVLRNMAQSWHVRGKLEKALHFSKEAIKIDPGTDKALTACLWYNVGSLLWMLQQSHEEAECAVSRSLHILTGLRNDHALPSPSIVDRYIVSAQTVLLLIQAHRERREQVDTVSLLNRLSEQWTLYGYEHELVCKTLLTLGIIYKKQRKFECAMYFLLEAYRIQEYLQLSDSAKLTTLTGLGQCLQPLGRDIEAMSCFKEALRLKGRSIFQEPAYVQAILATALYNIGMIQSCHGDRNDQQRRMRALHSFKLCLDIRRKALSPESPAIASALHNIGILMLEDDQVGKAMECFEESLLIRRKAYGPQHHEVASSMRYIGKIYHAQGDYHLAMQLHAEAVRILRKSSHDSSDRLLVEVLIGTGQAQHANGHLDQALKSYEEASSLLRKRKENEGDNVTHHMIRVLNVMGNLALDMVDIDSANRFFAEAALLSGEKYIVLNHVPPCASAA